MTQSWHDLLFAHWRVDERLLRPLIPPAFDVDTLRRLGVARHRAVHHDQRRATSAAGAAVAVVVSRAERAHLRQAARRQARRLLLQPRRRANPRGAGGARDGRACRTTRPRCRWRATAPRSLPEPPPGGAAEFEATYEPTGPPAVPARGTLEFFLTERYCLYHLDLLGRPSRLEIHHAPWQLQPARAEIARNTMADAVGVRARRAAAAALRPAPGRGGVVAQGSRSLQPLRLWPLGLSPLAFGLCRGGRLQAARFGLWTGMPARSARSPLAHLALDALNPTYFPLHQPTMNYGWLRDNTVDDVTLASLHNRRTRLGDIVAVEGLACGAAWRQSDSCRRCRSWRACWRDSRCPRRRCCSSWPQARWSSRPLRICAGGFGQPRSPSSPGSPRAGRSMPRTRATPRSRRRFAACSTNSSPASP